MPTCFVIQPFDGGKFDKRFKDTFEPAIRDAGLEPYRVDQDPRVQVPIEAIEKGISGAAICLADITANNPNVWYELGFAFAASRPVIMVCANDRTDFPFDIQHRTVIPYGTDSRSDFDDLRSKITARAKALLDEGAMVETLLASDGRAPRDAPSPIEVALLGILGNETEVVGSSGLPYRSLRRSAEQTSLRMIGVNIGLKRLVAREFIAISAEQDRDGDEYRVVSITEAGWAFIDANERMFTAQDVGHSRPQDPEDFEDDIPF